jgi:hypothetical protein
MKKRAPEPRETALQPASAELRAAQRAFAALIEAQRRTGEFRRAQLGGAARRTLSALSADDRARLAEWLSLLLATYGRQPADASMGQFARIDATFMAHVRRALPARVEALAARARPQHIVAA